MTTTNDDQNSGNNQSTQNSSFASTVKVDQDTCIGCGVCEVLCSQIFKVSEEKGKAYVLEDANHDEPVACEAESACPVSAISVNSN